MTNIPTGTVTFLFTDIEGSTKLWESVPEKMKVSLQRHHEILNCAIEINHGVVFQIIGDAFCAAFPTAPSAMSAAVKAQRELFEADWDLPSPVRVRMGIHTGLAETTSNDSVTGGYTSNQTLNRVARIMSAAHGGQILLSLATEELARDSLPENSRLHDLGEHHLKDVIHTEHLFQLNVSGLPTEFPPLKTLNSQRHNLPVQLTDFIGREKELAEIAEALAQNRLVTLIGSGGTGKTRLAIEAGAAQLTDQRFTNGVYFVALAPLETKEAIVPTIASSLSFSFYEGGEPRQQLLDYLREKSMLLIMDNFEHLLDGADLVTDILNTAPQVKILATSRARLNVQGEQLFHLNGMDFPNWEAPQDANDYSAVKLFTQTARRIHLDFELTPDSLKYITRICRLVEGMPLGILLAASWMEMLAPEEIATEIEKSLDFLETRQRDLPDRQHSMRAVFDYSWKFLTLGEQNVFMKASVFRGGFTREAAQQVTGASLRDLMGLVDKSLIQRNPNGRYGIHELLRQYGAEKLSNVLDELEAVRNQHSTYFAEFLHTREASLHGKGQRDVLAEIETEIENIKIGWDWAVKHVQIEQMANYLESIVELYDTRGWSQGGVRLVSLAVQKLSEVKKNDRATQLLLGRLWMWLGILGADFDTMENSNKFLQDSLLTFRELGARRELAYALSYSAILNSYLSENGNEPFGQESLHIFKELGDQHGITLALMALAYSALIQENYPLAKQRYQSGLTLLRESNDTIEIVRCLNGLGYVCWRLGEYQEAKQYHEESLLLSKMAGDKYGTAEALAHLGQDVYGMKGYKETEELFIASLEIYKEMGAVWGIANQLADLGALKIATEEYAQATQYAREALALYVGVTNEADNWELRIMGTAALGMGDLKTAQTYLRQSLQHAVKVRQIGRALLTLVSVARLFVEQGRKEFALELLTLIMNHRTSWQMAKDQAAPLITELEAKLHPEIAAQAKERGRARDLDATVAELLDELKE